MRKPTLALIVICLMASASLAQPKSPGVLRFGQRRELTTMNPFVGTISYDHNLRTLMYEPLLLEDKNYQIRPYLAEAWDISKDGLIYTFNIKRGVKFHGGKELFANDIQWSIEYAQDPKNVAYAGPALRSIISVSTAGPNRLRLTLKEPLASLLSLMTTLQTFAILPKDSLKTAEKPQVFPPGTGPYRFEQWKSGQGVTLTRFQDYWQKGIPRIERIEIKVIPNEEARFAGLRADDLDLIERVPLQYVPKIERGEIAGFKIQAAEASGLKGLVFNTQRPPFDNLKMRQMIAYALSPEEILTGAYWGVGSVVNQKMSPGFPWYFPIPERKRDLAAARRLLKEAGYGPGFRMKLAGTRNSVDEMSVIQSQLREAGVQADLELRDQIETLKVYVNGEFEVAFSAAGISSDPDLNYFDSFHSEILQEGKGRRNNHSGYSNPRADALLEEGRRTLDPQKRYKLYHEFVALMHQEIPFLYLLTSPNLYIHKTQLKGFEVRGEGRYFSGDAGLPFAWIDR